MRRKSCCRKFMISCSFTDRITSHPNLEFVIVVNPNSGPGTELLPDASYAAEIPLLNAQINVRTVGYVRLDYCKRSLAEVEDDVAKYAGWSTDPALGLGMQGIFFDETPNLHSSRLAAYLNSVNRMVKESEGIGGSRLVRKALSSQDGMCFLASAAS